MPDQSSAAQEHALLEQITGPLASLPDNPVAITADVDFPIALRGYDRIAVDAYVARTSQLIAELHATASPEGAIRRALERVGEEVSGVLQQAHRTANEVTSQSRAEAEDRLCAARQEAAQITGQARERLHELDEDTDRIWAERDRIVTDARDLARQLTDLANAASARFPAAEDPVGGAVMAVEPEPVGDAGEPEPFAADAAEPEPRDDADGVADADGVDRADGADGADGVYDVEGGDDAQPTAILWRGAVPDD